MNPYEAYMEMQKEAFLPLAAGLAATPGGAAVIAGGAGLAARAIPAMQSGAAAMMNRALPAVNAARGMLQNAVRTPVSPMAQAGRGLEQARAALASGGQAPTPRPAPMQP